MTDDPKELKALLYISLAVNIMFIIANTIQG